MRKVVTACALMAATQVAAQEGAVANNTAFGDWVVACEAVSTAQTSCRILQTQQNADTGALVAQFIAYPQPEGGALLVAQMPIGVYLPGGAVFRAAEDEEAEQQGMVWQRCFGQICEAALALDAEAVANLTASGRILFGYQANPGEPAVITAVDVSTFAEALDAIRPQ